MQSKRAFDIIFTNIAGCLIVATDKNFLNFVKEQLSLLEDVSFRPMMGEYLVYYRGKLIGGICDDKLFIKPVAAAVEFVREPIFAPPYSGAKDMLVIEDLEDKEFLRDLFDAAYPFLPAPKNKKK